MADIPQHVAIIMDGNGRWAQQRGLPRHAGHHAGVKAVREIIKQCILHGVSVLTLFAFSSENWARPKEEVGLLIELFNTALRQELKRLQDNGVRLRVVGDRTAFPLKLQKSIERSERETADNDQLTLQVAANYGGRWDITQAARNLAREVSSGVINSDAITEKLLADRLVMSEPPAPDLLIRTGGECRLSNFMIWQLAYTELYFTDTHWPDFDRDAFLLALQAFERRQRRFGQTSEQVIAGR